MSRDETIYQQLRNAIVGQDLLSATRLPEDALSNVFGVSRTVIRKVLQRLALERLVTIRPRRGAEVTEPTVEEARNVFAARRCIECHAMTDVVANSTPGALRDLNEMVAQEQAAEWRNDQSEAIRLSASFHVQLVAIGGNALITEFLEQLTSMSSLIIAVYGSRASVGCKPGGHSELCELIEIGDAKAASDWMEKHLRQIESTLDFRKKAADAPDFAKLFSASANKRKEA
ncbi:MAG: GntR family transcriptional regulator [Spiribacter sp.]|nr:GntR family transcriptional regulator [Spiribacter sp.]MDR9489775.1 GntR family transcriptional regulator [Spiribacter sp.]